MLCGFYFLLTEIRTTFLIQINCKSYSTNIRFMDLQLAYFSFFWPIICCSKGSLQRQGSKGLSRHKPASLSRTSHLFHVPLTAQPSSAFCCLTEDHPNDYARLEIGSPISSKFVFLLPQKLPDAFWLGQTCHLRPVVAMEFILLAKI
jgi:hypothetical protein